jgi:subtilisin family serine protease
MTFRFLCSFCSFTWILLATGCGDEKSQYDVDQKVSGVTWPTRDNFSGWQSLWDKKSWIVALSRKNEALKKREALQNSVVQSLIGTLSKQDVRFASPEMSVEFSGLLKTHVLAIPNFEKTLLTGSSPLPLFGFGTVTLRDGFVGLQQMLLRSPFFTQKFQELRTGFASERFIVSLMWDALEATPGIEFAEPNLESEILRDASALADAQKSQESTQSIGVGDVMPQMEGKGQSLVAVIDTGVDSSLDAPGGPLEGRFFRNGGEDPQSGKKPLSDDDGNGWIDDYIGIDATVPKGETDPGPGTLPGSNDIGGQGAACPSSTGLGKSSQSCGHGTHVAGIIAGWQDGIYAGVCPLNCKILPIRAARRCFANKNDASDICEPANEASSFNPDTQREFDGGITDAAQLAGLSYLLDLESPNNPGQLATNVVNLSIGRYFSSRALSLITRRLFQNDILVVAAAGNQNVEIPMFPAAYRDVVAVCATSTATGESEDTGDGKTSAPSLGVRYKARFSNYGDWVDICAPGSGITSSHPAGGTILSSGTSQAAPHVSGVAGLLKAYRPSLTAADIRSILLRYSDFDFLYGLLADGRRVNADFEYSPYDGIKVFLLGSGGLSAVNAFYSLTDVSKARVSQATSAIESGDTSQVTSGCIVSNLAANDPRRSLERNSSLPVTLLLGYVLMRWLSRFKKKPG